jgi:F-type H+-transporting ATPase subunit b
MIEVNPPILVVQVICFLIMVFVVWKVAWKPLMKSLDDRASTIRDSLEDVEKASRQLEEAAEQQKEILAKAYNDAQLVLQRSRETAQNEAVKIADNARREAERMVESAKKEITSHKEEAIRELRDEAATMAIMAASKLIEANLDDERNRKLVNEYISDLARKVSV